MSADHPTAEELAISEFRREVAVGMTEIGGQLALLVQRAGQSDQRFERIDRSNERLEARVEEIDRTKVSREEMNEKGRRTLVLVGLIVAAIGVTVTAAGVLVTIIVGGA